MATPLFVYGTLRPGGALFPMIEMLVGEHKPAIARGMAIYGRPGRVGYPFGVARDATAARAIEQCVNLTVGPDKHVRAEEEEGRVVGDLIWPKKGYEDLLYQHADRIESAPNLFRREKIKVEVDGKVVDAWVYLYARELPESAELVPEQDWMRQIIVE